MFSKLMLCQSCHFKPRKLLICLAVLEVLVVLLVGIHYFSFRHRTVKGEPHLRETSQLHNSAGTIEVYDNEVAPYIHHLQGPRDNKTDDVLVTANSKVASMKYAAVSSLIMDGCPVGWPLQVIRYDSAKMPAAQVCRRAGRGNRIGPWKCARGWGRLHGDPYCIKNFTSSTTDPHTISSSDKENFAPSEFKTRHFVAEKHKLLFHKLPGTSVEVSPPAFRAVGENETIALLKQYYNVTVIMHPCLRLINVWELMSTYSGVNVSFKSFLNGRLPPRKSLLLYDETHLKTQTEMLLGNRGRLWSNQILVLERWNESLAELEKLSVRPNASLFLRATSSSSEKCSRMYSPELWLKMTNSYAIDFCVLQYSTGFNETDGVPSLHLTMKELASRYHSCRQTVTSFQTSSLSNLTQPHLVSPNLCTIHTYYQPAFDQPKKGIENQNILRVWEKAWVAAGWRTRVINETDAKLHPDFEEMKEKFQVLPTINADRYTLGNFLRHVAMAAVGGGWMADYDTLPLNFPSCLKIPFNGSYTVWSGYVPALVSANANDYTRVAHLMADVGLQWRARPQFFIKQGWGEQVSDMRALSVLVKEGHVKSFRVIIEKDDFSHGGFACNKSKRIGKGSFENLPEGMPLIPWGVHVSHAFIRTTKDRNITLWPGQSWEKDTSPSFRPTFMKYVYNIYQRKCKVVQQIIPISNKHKLVKRD